MHSGKEGGWTEVLKAAVYKRIHDHDKEEHIGHVQHLDELRVLGFRGGTPASHLSSKQVYSTGRCGVWLIFIPIKECAMEPSVTVMSAATVCFFTWPPHCSTILI